MTDDLFKREVEEELKGEISIHYDHEFVKKTYQNLSKDAKIYVNQVVDDKFWIRHITEKPPGLSDSGFGTGKLNEKNKLHQPMIKKWLDERAWVINKAIFENIDLEAKAREWKKNQTHSPAHEVEKKAGPTFLAQEFSGKQFLDHIEASLNAESSDPDYTKSEAAFSIADRLLKDTPDLSRALRTPEGKIGITRLYDALVNASDKDEKYAEMAARLIKAAMSSYGRENLAKQLEKPTIPIFRLYFGWGSTGHISAKFENGKIRVKMPNSALDDYLEQARKEGKSGNVPQEVFGPGKEYDPFAIVGVRRMDKKFNDVVYVPAFYLLLMGKESSQSISEKQWTLINLGLLVAGNPVGSISEAVTAAKALKNLEEMGTGLAKLGKILDATAKGADALGMTVFIGSSVVTGLRPWIESTWGEKGEKLIQALEIANCYAAVFGITHLAARPLLQKLNSAWNDCKGSSSTLNAADRARAEDLNRLLEKYNAKWEKKYGREAPVRIRETSPPEARNLPADTVKLQDPAHPAHADTVKMQNPAHADTVRASAREIKIRQKESKISQPGELELGATIPISQKELEEAATMPISSRKIPGTTTKSMDPRWLVFSKEVTPAMENLGKELVKRFDDIGIPKPMLQDIQSFGYSPSVLKKFLDGCEKTGLKPIEIRKKFLIEKELLDNFRDLFKRQLPGDKRFPKGDLIRGTLKAHDGRVRDAIASRKWSELIHDWKLRHPKAKELGPALLRKFDKAAEKYAKNVEKSIVAEIDGSGMKIQIREEIPVGANIEGESAHKIKIREEGSNPSQSAIDEVVVKKQDSPERGVISSSQNKVPAPYSKDLMRTLGDDVAEKARKMGMEERDILEYLAPMERESMLSGGTTERGPVYLVARQEISRVYDILGDDIARRLTEYGYSPGSIAQAIDGYGSSERIRLLTDVKLADHLKDTFYGGSLQETRRALSGLEQDTRRAIYAEKWKKLTDEWNATHPGKAMTHKEQLAIQKKCDSYVKKVEEQVSVEAVTEIKALEKKSFPRIDERSLVRIPDTPPVEPPSPEKLPKKVRFK